MVHHTCRNSWVGAMNPELPTTGSRMTPAISSLLSAKICFTLSMSLYFAHSVVAAHTACKVFRHTLSAVPTVLGVLCLQAILTRRFEAAQPMFACDMVPHGHRLEHWQACSRRGAGTHSTVMLQRDGVQQNGVCTCGSLWHAGRVRESKCEDAAAGLDQERVRVAVVAPGELDQLHEGRIVEQ